ncbi:MAG: hypothetical protein ABJL71_03415 [Cyclobacteriaceae bacterium]|uniref:pectate lyase family protein n=1 Tax=Reichenbachiella sp. TaxID=2184521 RepID=UPI0032636523
MSNIKHTFIGLMTVVLFLSCQAEKNISPDEQEPGDSLDISTDPFADLITDGGLGGDVIKVTNLNQSGAGSLKAALESSGPRIVVFEVGGVIDLGMTTLTISNPNVTVAGHTAPFPGITLIKGGLLITTHDVVIKHLKVRPGDAGQAVASGWEPDGITIYGEEAHHITIDHCSITWAVDENVGISGKRPLGVGHTSRKIVLSNNIIAEALSVSSHSEGEHSKGTLVFDNSQEILIKGNLYAHNKDRNPFFKANTTGVIVNNLIVNPGTAAMRGGYVESEWEGLDITPDYPTLDIIGNVMYAGANTGSKTYLLKGEAYAFEQDNIMEGDGFTLIKLDPQVDSYDVPFFRIENLTIIPASDVVDEISSDAGAFPANRDAIDQRIIENAINNTGKIINSQDEVGGYLEYEMQTRKLTVPEAGIDIWLEEMEKEVLN